MAQSDARFGYKANPSREDFDLSQKLGFTSASGMLLPIWCDIATPGDAYYIQHDLPLLRSSVLAQPAMVDVKVHYETFFVPAQMIYQPFENTIFSLKNLQSSNYNMSNLMNNNFPLWNYANFVAASVATTDDYRADAFRLADLFGLGSYNFADANQGGSSSTPVKPYKYVPSFFPWQLLTYHAIFEYYYRLDDKSQFQNDFCNWDKYYGTSTGIVMGRDFMSIHQRPWDFDYFTSLYRSPIVSDDNLQSVMGYGKYSDLINKSNSPIDSTGNDTGISNSDFRAWSSGLPSSYTANNIQVSISSANIRQMFANEKLAMITGRTKKNYDSQVLAHYGVSVPHDVKHDLTMIHHDEYDLNVQEVTSLAASTGNPLGELAGKSYAAGDGKKFKFVAPCHGFIMTIFSIEPKKRYTPCFDRINAVTNAFDLPTPEFDRLGNQPMFRYEVGWLSEQTVTKDGSDIIGWKERYYWNKRKYDKTTLAFFTPLSGSGGVVNDYAPYMLSFRPFGLNTGLLAGEQRPDLESRFYIERNAVDSLCVIPFAYGWKEVSGGENWSETPWLAYARDPFIVNSFVKCTKVSWMSKDGEPIYNW